MAYELVAVARTPRPSGAPTLVEVGPIVAPTISWTDELSGPGDIQFSCDADRLDESVRLRLRDLATYPTEVWVRRDGTIVAAGPVVGWQILQSTLTVRAVGLLGYLAYMQVAGDLAFSGVDQTLIGKELVDQWQTLGYGHFGIDTSAIVASGVTRDRTYSTVEQHQVLTRLLQLADVDDGFDAWVEPGTRELRLDYPARGSDLTDSVVIDRRNIADSSLSVSVAPGDVATEAVGVGTSSASVLFGRDSNDALKRTFGRAGVSAQFDGVTQEATLTRHIARLLDDRAGMLFQPSGGLVPVEDVDVDAFGPGDTVTYVHESGLGLHEGAYRVAQKQVSVDDVGSETIRVAFA